MKVLVATKDLPVGTILDPTSVKFASWPKDGMVDSYYAQSAPDSDPSKIAGDVVRYPITAGQPLTHGAVVSPQDRGFLAAALTPGMRAITVPVDVTSDLSGLVFPGDRVDMMLTQTIKGAGGPPLKVTETIVRNIRVLAADQRMSVNDKDGKPKIKTARHMTLEVTPRLAEKITVARTIGKLSLTLRSLGDGASDMARAIASGQIKVPAGTSPDAERQMLTAFADRPMDTNTTYTTGGDVSRFQRRSLPAKTPPANAGKSALATPAVYTGPVVRVARGNSISVVQVGAR